MELPKQGAALAKLGSHRETDRESDYLGKRQMGPAPEGDLYLPTQPRPQEGGSLLLIFMSHLAQLPPCWGRGWLGYGAILLLGVLKPSGGKKSEHAAPDGH